MYTIPCGYGRLNASPSFSFTPDPLRTQIPRGGSEATLGELRPSHERELSALYRTSSSTGETPSTEARNHQRVRCPPRRSHPRGRSLVVQFLHCSVIITMQFTHRTCSGGQLEEGRGDEEERQDPIR
ncbi:hypothetical protein BDM02DRAFT_3109254 [Thelephora ganbajun]|uniref:Uncharacterized protein n=1 Tax=Thelephora ganbajun TaxID=370292 RepID=A0ACB6ZS41_THEGA|nr:hypothetical protein BDM02DRAFT_3109254 [Thelephora ganbajun]